MKDKPEDIVKILDRFNALQTDIAAFKKNGGVYAALVEQLGLGQRMIKSVSLKTETKAERDYRMTFAKENKPSEPPTDFKVYNGQHTQKSGCYVIDAASEDKDPSCYRVRLYLSESCTGSTTDSKPCLVLEWPRGDKKGADWTKGGTPTNDHEWKNPHNGDYMLGKVGCAGMSTKLTGLAVSSSIASLGVTGASAGFNGVDIAIGIWSHKFRVADYSANGMKICSKGMEMDASDVSAGLGDSTSELDVQNAGAAVDENLI